MFACEERKDLLSAGSNSRHNQSAWPPPPDEGCGGRGGGGGGGGADAERQSTYPGGAIAPGSVATNGLI